MSIKKEVICRSEIYQIYSSEYQERMKVYFKLTEQYQKCLQTTENTDELQSDFSQNLCEHIYDDYSKSLAVKYVNNSEKLDEKVTNSPIFTVEKTPESQTLWYRIFHN